MITCLLLPYFAATQARRERGTPEQVPMILYSGEKVAATCAQAAARGIGFGMALRQAKWLCPDAQVFPINYQTLRQHMGDVVQMLGQFTHLVEVERLPARLKPRTPPFADARQSAVFYIDLERLNQGEAQQLAQAMGSTLRKATGFSAACGLAAAKFPAYGAAAETRAGHLRIVASGEERTFLAALPISLLPMPAETQRRLLLLGIETLGAFATLPVAAAAAQCGKDGVLLHQLARGLDSRRVVPTALQVVERVTRDLELPVSELQILEAILRSMATELSLRLQLSGSMGKTLHLQLLLDNHEAMQQKTTLRQPVSSSRYLTEALLRLLARTDVQTGICGVVVTLADLMPFAGQQLELFPDRVKPRERLQQRLSSLLTRSDAPECYWITTQDPGARRIEHRYRHERVAPL